MALPFVLSAGLRRAMPFIESAVIEGLSSNAISRALRAGGMGVQRQNLLDYVRWSRGEEIKKEAIRGLRRDLKPNIDRLRTSITKLRRRYSYKVGFTGFNPHSGKKEERWITVATDNLLSPSEAEGIAEDTIENDRENYPIQVEKTYLIDIQKAGLTGTLT